MTHHHRRDEWAKATERERAHLLFSLLLAMEEKLMTVSAEVQKILDDVKQNKDIVASVDTGMKALQQQVKDLQDQITNQTPSLSAEDKAALTSAASDLESSISTLQSDIPANTTPAGGSGGSGGGSGANPNTPPPVAPVGSPDAPTGMPGDGDAASANGPSNHPAGGSAPLMPTMAFDPNPTATAASVLTGQPASTFPSAGGFVVNPPPGQAGSGPAGSAGAVAPTSVVPNAAGGVTVLAGQVGPGAPISNTGGVESATDADGKPLATSGAIPKDGAIADAEGAPPPPPVNPVVLGTVVPPSPDQIAQASQGDPNAPPPAPPVSPPPTLNPPPGSPSNPQNPAV